MERLGTMTSMSLDFIASLSPKLERLYLKSVSDDHGKQCPRLTLLENRGREFSFLGMYHSRVFLLSVETFLTCAGIIHHSGILCQHGILDGKIPRNLLSFFVSCFPHFKVELVEVPWQPRD